MRHCLIVDDSRVIRTVARRLFEDLQFTAAEAEDAMSALRACREKMPDLIFLDWSLPGMSSADFVHNLRAQAGGESPVVLACVTQIDAAQIAGALAAGIDDYVMKPFDRAVLIAKLAEIDAHREAPRKAAGV